MIKLDDFNIKQKIEAAQNYLLKNIFKEYNIQSSDIMI